jgi:hypothetical protein
MNVHLLDQSHIYHFQAKEDDNFFYVTIHTNKGGDFTLWEMTDKHGEKVRGPLESEIVNKIRLDWDKLVR